MSTGASSKNEKSQHATIVLERTYRAPLEQVFSEFADPGARSRWTTPSNDALIYDQTDFRVGGRDVFRCGPKNDLKFRGETSYHLIVPYKRVVSTETLDTEGERLAVSLHTLDFDATGKGTHLKVTVQMVSFVGAGMIAGYESGNKSALENLARDFRPWRRRISFNLRGDKTMTIESLPGLSLDEMETRRLSRDGLHGAPRKYGRDWRGPPLRDIDGRCAASILVARVGCLHGDVGRVFDVVREASRL
jgi:uncharacterized protein YndB with AHSA1/START domain